MNNEFLETYPLYRKCSVQHLGGTISQIPVVNINMACGICKDIRTFSMRNGYAEFTGQNNFPSAGLVSRWVYRCSDCQQFERFFLVKISKSLDWIMKVGQFPPWEVKIDKEVSTLLGTHADLYQKGLVCESQGYGIGAFGYFRRIVEVTIDQLLSEISELIPADERSEYQEALKKTEATIVTQEKIELVKDLLPTILRPDNINPLQILHSALSEGLHAQSDEQCLEYAESIRNALIYLVTQLSVMNQSTKEFTQNMRKLLDKKSEK